MNGREVRLRKPEDALAAGIVLIPEDRATEGLCLTLCDPRQHLARQPEARLYAGAFCGRSRSAASSTTWSSGSRSSSASTQQEVGSLSGGNQQKVLLGRVLAQQPLLLLMYDATRGVDVGTKTEIYRLMRELCAQGISILFYSTDVSELSNLADRVLVLHDGAVRATLAGDELTDAPHPRRRPWAACGRRASERRRRRRTGRAARDGARPRSARTRARACLVPRVSQGRPPVAHAVRLRDRARARDLRA